MAQVGREPGSPSDANLLPLLCPLQLLLRDAAGNVVEPVRGLSSPVTLLPTTGRGVQVGLSQDVLGAVLGLAQKQGAFSLDITSSAVGWGSRGAAEPGRGSCRILLAADPAGAVPTGTQ